MCTDKLKKYFWNKLFPIKLFSDTFTASILASMRSRESIDYTKMCLFFASVRKNILFQSISLDNTLKYHKLYLVAVIVAGFENIAHSLYYEGKR